MTFNSISDVKDIKSNYFEEVSIFASPILFTCVYDTRVIHGENYKKIWTENK